MTSRKRVFPPQRIADLSPLSASHFMSLLKDIKEAPITLILGAGVSASAGLPLWNRLLEDICMTFFFHWKLSLASGKETNDRPPRDLSIAVVHNSITSGTFKILNEVFMNISGKFGIKKIYEPIWDDEFEESVRKFREHDSLLVAQQIKNCVNEANWRYMVRKIVYNYDPAGHYHINRVRFI